MAEKRPTILQIIPELDTGGAELSTIEIADAITSAGGRCHRADRGRPAGATPARHRRRGAVLSRRGQEPLRLLWNAHRIANVIRRDGVDLVHARSRAPAWSALIAARRTGVPFVTTYHGAYSEKSDAKRLYNSVMARGDAVIANSHYTSDLIRMRYGTPRNKVHVIYRGVDGRLFDPGQRGARARRRRARPLGHRRQEARHPARRTPDDVEGPEVRHRSGRAAGAAGARSTTPCSSLPATRSGAVPTGRHWRRRSTRPGSMSACASSATRTTWPPPSAPRTSPSSPRSSRKRSAVPRRKRR